jgi:ATP-dependent Zn protease
MISSTVAVQMKGLGASFQAVRNSSIACSVQVRQALARQILKANLQVLHRLADALLRYETLDREQVEEAVRDALPHDANAMEPAMSVHSCMVWLFWGCS